MIELAGIAWILLVASVFFISMGFLFLFLFAGFWIFIVGGIIGLWTVIAIMLFPIFLPILLPLLIIFLFIVYRRKKQEAQNK
jgi:hypothetical protein